MNPTLIGISDVFPLERLLDADSPRGFPTPDFDPLQESHALQEGALIDLRLEALYGKLGVLLDLRVALHFDVASVGVLVAHDLRRFEWLCEHPDSSPIWHAVVGSTVRAGESSVLLDLDFTPDAQLKLSAPKIEFYGGTIEDIGPTPPDFVSDVPSTIQARMPSWSSLFVPQFSTVLKAIGTR